MTKKEARERMKKKRRSMPAMERRQQDSQIRSRLMGLPCWKKVSWFFPYVSYGTEVDTQKIIEYVLKMGQDGAGIRVAVPRVEGEEMNFYEITSLDQLEKSQKGIPEPVGGQRVEAREGIMLLPGLAFDRKLHRIGYGGGYYDKYLARYGGPDLITLAVAYEYQVVDGELEHQPTDICPMGLVTPQQFITYRL